MKIIRKCITIIFSAALFLCTGCQMKDAALSDSLQTIMDKLYKNIPEDQLPMALEDVQLDKDNEAYFLGSDKIEYVEGLAREPAVSSIAYSVVLLRVKEDADVEALVKTIQSSVDPDKWVCVEAQSVIVESRGDVILVVMADQDQASAISKAFEDLQ